MIFWRDESPNLHLVSTHLFYIHQNGEIIAKPAGTIIPPEDMMPTGLVASYIEAGATEDGLFIWLNQCYDRGLYSRLGKNQEQAVEMGMMRMRGSLDMVPG